MNRIAEAHPEHSAPVQPVHDPSGWLVDPQTGEMVGRWDVKPEFHVTDAGSANWVLERMAEAESEATAVALRLAAITERMHTMIAEHARKRQWLETRFGPELEQFAREAVAGGKRQSVKLDHGTLGFRTAPGGISVADTERALLWCEMHAEDAIKTTRSVLVTPLKGRERELPGGVFEIREPETRFYIKVP